MAETSPSQTGRAVALDDTIAAIATPLGEGGLGVIRLSGSDAFSIASSLFTPSGGHTLASAPTHTLHHGWVADGKKKLDEGIAAVFRRPQSYTGEDSVEISCHGSPAVLKEVLNLCLAKGGRLAGPGEFTQRAFLNGKMDLSQAEAIADLIAAKSSRTRQAAAAQLEGALSRHMKSMRDPLIALLAHIEANLDFAEEEVPDIQPSDMEGELNKAIHATETLLSTAFKGRVLRDGIRVVFAGKPNVGKSSLFNALLSEDRAIVTAVPGTTRDTLEEQIQWKGWPIILIDAAGVGPAKNVVDKKGRERALKAHRQADAVLFVVDGSEKLTRKDEAVYRGLKKKRVVGILNKNDKKMIVSKASFPKKFPCAALVETSAVKGAGLPELKEAVVGAVRTEGGENGSSPVIMNVRHGRHLEQALEHLKKAMKAVQKRRSEEAVALDVREALEEMGAVTGESVSEDVLASIFRRFCIGK